MLSVRLELYHSKIPWSKIVYANHSIAYFLKKYHNSQSVILLIIFCLFQFLYYYYVTSYYYLIIILHECLKYLSLLVYSEVKIFIRSFTLENAFF